MISAKMFFGKSGWLAALIGSCLIGILSPREALAQATPADLLKVVPETANAVMVVRVTELVNSPRGKRENWDEKKGGNFLGGALDVAPWVELLVRASHVTTADRDGDWTVSLAPRPAAVTLETLAERHLGTLETIADRQVLRTPRGFAAEVRPGILGLMTPPQRQVFARWIRGEFVGQSHPLSEYLRTTAVNADAPIVIAYDLRDMLDPVTLARRLAISKALAGKPQEIEGMVKLLTQILGARMAIMVDEKITAELQFNFLVDVPPEGKLLREIAAEIAGDTGAALAELDAASVEVKGKTVSLKMELTQSSLEQILTLLMAPLPEQAQQTAAIGPQNSKNPPAVKSPPPKVGDLATLAATRSYFQEVTRLLLQLQSLNRRAKNYDKTAAWHENYAARIRQLSPVAVDPAVLQFGANSAARLEALAASLRGIPVDVGLLQNQVRTTVNVGFWPHGFWSVDGYHPAPWEVNSNLQEVQAAQQEAIVKGADQRNQIWQQIDNERIQVRNAMSAKYGVDIDNK